MNIFVICPVRNASQEVSDILAAHVDALERKGHQVHWPPRDTNQNDPVGLNICMQNAGAIHMADEVHIWYDPESQGTIFDLGALLMSSRIVWRRQRIRILNRDAVVPTEGKSFTNVLLAMAEAE